MIKYAMKQLFDTRRLNQIAIFSAIFILAGCSSNRLDTRHNIDHPIPTSFAIATAHPLATNAGATILRKGGNAFDAAIAIAASLGVVEPYGSGIGGGGFWLLYDNKSKRYVTIDARERAPFSAHKDLFIEAGKVNRELAINSALSAGIPGQVAAFEHITQHYSTMPLSTTLLPAIEQARDGFSVTPHYQKMVGYRQNALSNDPHSRIIFLDNNTVPNVGGLIKQPGLQATLQAIAEQGGDAFYRGDIAEALVKSVTDKGGIWTLQDLEQYQVIERNPITTHFQGHKIISAPPPSSGGVALATLFQSLAPYQLSELAPNERYHLLTEVMRRAYYDRAHYLGDPDFTDIPLNRLTSREHATEIMRLFSAEKATPSTALGPPITGSPKGTNTTHFSVLDQHGNMASVTLSINLAFGSGITAGETGILLNNEMDDFSAKPGTPNAYGLVGNAANQIEPGKRPLSSMTPTIIEMPHGKAILGTPGGSRIISMVFLASLEAINKKEPKDWVSLPRFHHQYLPDYIQYEPESFTAHSMETLKAKGHSMKNTNRRYGNMQAILWDQRKNSVSAASDPRGIGSAIVESIE